MRSATPAALQRAAFQRELLDRIASFELTDNIAELETVGYTVLRDAAPLELFGGIRDRLLDLGNGQRHAHRSEGLNALFGTALGQLLARGRVFEEAVLNPKLRAVMTYLLGDGHVLNVVTGSVVPEGNPPMPLHCDNNFVPDPFPPHALVATAVWVLDDFTADGGATRVVPGSHRLGRHPLPGEADELAVPVECPAGSIVVWNGSTWHGNCGRTRPGERVVLHTSFCRMHLKPFLDVSAIPDEVIDRNPPELAALLGRGLPFGDEGRSGTHPAGMARAGALFTRRL